MVTESLVLKLTPPSGPIPDETFELVVKALAFTTVAVRLASEPESRSPEIDRMVTLLAKLVPDDQNMAILETWAVNQLMASG